MFSYWDGRGKAKNTEEDKGSLQLCRLPRPRAQFDPSPWRLRPNRPGANYPVV